MSDTNTAASTAPAPQAPPAAPPTPAQPAPQAAPAAPAPSEPAPAADPAQAATPTEPVAPSAPPEPPPDPRLSKYAKFYETGQWDDPSAAAPPQPAPQGFDDIRSLIEQRLPAPQPQQGPDPFDKMTQLLANGDVRGFMEAQAEYLSQRIKPAEAPPPIDPQQLLAQVAQVVQVERQINEIQRQAVEKNRHLEPLRQAIIEPRVAQLVEQAQASGRIKSDADVPVAYRAAIDVAIKEANALYAQLRGPGPNANVVRTDVVAASPGSNVAERDAAPVGQQPTPDSVTTTSYLDWRNKLRVGKKEPVPFGPARA